MGDRMQRSLIILSLVVGVTGATAVLSAPGIAEAAERGRYSIIADPHDQRPGAITRPANDADRAWRKTRRSPEIVVRPQRRATLRQPIEAPRYDGRGRRLNVPGRPDTYDQIGRANALNRSRVTVEPIGPTVRTDSASRINQLAPR